MLRSFSLYELNEHIRRTLALNLPDAVWVSCELAQVKRTHHHFFLSLVEKAEHRDELLAQAEAVVWANAMQRMKASAVGGHLEQLLREGVQVRMKVKVDFHERYGTKLIVEDIDADYTLGLLSLKRQEILNRLEREGLLRLNKTRPLPLVVQKIALISSPTAAGFQDFMNHIAENDYNYKFTIQLFESSMQGQFVERDILEHLATIERRKSDFDLVAIVRGGGARLDLNDFDNYSLAKAIAECAIPVVTGIGHFIDQTLVDEVSHTALKTPTAVADFCIQHNFSFELNIEKINNFLDNTIAQKIANEQSKLEKIYINILNLFNQNLSKAEMKLTQVENLLPKFLTFRLQMETQRLAFVEKHLETLIPENILKKGYAIILNDKGALVREPQQTQEDEVLNIVLANNQQMVVLVKK